MTDQVYSQILKRYKEVYEIQPNDLHNHVGTDLFKRAAPWLKENPFLIIIPFALAISLALVVVHPSGAVWLASLLQYGF